jgi:hypothetical protein
MNMPQELLTQELLQAVKMHYLPEEYAATNFLDPIVGFIHDCDTDILLFERLQKMRLVLVTMRLIKLFPYQLLDELYLTEKIGRLRYLKKIFVEGLPRYSVSTR